MLTNLSEIIPPDLEGIKARLDKCIEEINTACKGITKFPIKVRLSEPPIDYVEQHILLDLLKKAGWGAQLSDSNGYSKKEWGLYPLDHIVKRLYFPDEQPPVSYKPMAM